MVVVVGTRAAAELRSFVYAIAAAGVVDAISNGKKKDAQNFVLLLCAALSLHLSPPNQLCESK